MNKTESEVTMKKNTCIICNETFMSKRKAKLCSDKCKSVRMRQHSKANRERIFLPVEQRKSKKCHTHKCNNIVHKQMSDGTELCRTCLARHNMYGGVDKPSPTTVSHIQGSVYKNGFNNLSPRSQAIIAGEEFKEKIKLLKDKKRKAHFAKGYTSSKAFRDFYKDSRGK